MTFIKNVINAYNKTFTNSKESIHYDSTSVSYLRIFLIDLKFMVLIKNFL